MPPSERISACCAASWPVPLASAQLRQLEADGIVERTVHSQVPAKVDYRMTAWGQALCPALDAMLKWAELRQPQDGP